VEIYIKATSGDGLSELSSQGSVSETCLAVETCGTRIRSMPASLRLPRSMRNKVKQLSIREETVNCEFPRKFHLLTSSISVNATIKDSLEASFFACDIDTVFHSDGN
jgi:hypothetical protein